MKTKTDLSLCIIFILSFMLFSCGQPKGETGKIGEWVKGKRFSVKVNSESVLEIQNDSDNDVKILPLKIVGWYTKSRKGVYELSDEQWSSGPLPPHMKFFLEINDILMISTDNSEFGTQASLLDIELERVEISVGGEFFNITR